MMGNSSIRSQTLQTLHADKQKDPPQRTSHRVSTFIQPQVILRLSARIRRYGCAVWGVSPAAYYILYSAPACSGKHFAAVSAPVSILPAFCCLSMRVLFSIPALL